MIRLHLYFHLSHTRVYKREYTRRNNRYSSILIAKLICFFTKYFILHCFIRYFGQVLTIMLSSFAFVNASLETSLRQNQLLMTSRILSPADPHILNISVSFNYTTCLAEVFFSPCTIIFKHFCSGSLVSEFLQA